MTKAGIDPASGVELIQQQFDMQALLNREIDAAQAMTYNEYAMVLETVNLTLASCTNLMTLMSSTGMTKVPRCTRMQSGRQRNV